MQWERILIGSSTTKMLSSSLPSTHLGDGFNALLVLALDHWVCGPRLLATSFPARSASRCRRGFLAQKAPALPPALRSMVVGGVLDGHGKKGHDVVDALLRILPREIAAGLGASLAASSSSPAFHASSIASPVCCLNETTVPFQSSPAAALSASPPSLSSVAKGLEAAFLASQRALKQETRPFAHRTSGAAVVAAVVLPAGCVLANAGDCAALVLRRKRELEEVCSSPVFHQSFSKKRRARTTKLDCSLS